MENGYGFVFFFFVYLSLYTVLPTLNMNFSLLSKSANETKTMKKSQAKLTNCNSFFFQRSTWHESTECMIKSHACNLSVINMYTKRNTWNVQRRKKMYRMKQRKTQRCQPFRLALTTHSNRKRNKHNLPMRMISREFKSEKKKVNLKLSISFRTRSEHRMKSGHIFTSA